MELLQRILRGKTEPGQSNAKQASDQLMRILDKPLSDITIENRSTLCTDDRAMHLLKDVKQTPIKSEIPKKTVVLTAIGNTEPFCPYCNFKFDKMPQKKKKCPNCNNFIISHNRPLDGKNVLLKEDQMNELGAQWSAKLAPTDFLRISEEYILAEARSDTTRLKK